MEQCRKECGFSSLYHPISDWQRVVWAHLDEMQSRNTCLRLLPSKVVLGILQGILPSKGKWGMISRQQLLESLLNLLLVMGSHSSLQFLRWQMKSRNKGEGHSSCTNAVHKRVLGLQQQVVLVLQGGQIVHGFIFLPPVPGELCQWTALLHSVPPGLTTVLRIVGGFYL